MVSSVMLAICLSATSTCHAQSGDELQFIHNQLSLKITQHENTYPTGDLKHHPAYIQALEIMAKDRDEAQAAARDAQASNDPEAKRFYHGFIALAERAQSKGDGVLELADVIFRIEDNWGPRSWGTLCVVAEQEGKPIYMKAGELEFNQNITRQQIRMMLSTALKDLDTGWSLRCGSGHVGYLYPTPDRDPMTEADRGLGWVQEVRALAEYFALPGVHSAATELMNRYLKDALCLLPRGHQWYLGLAKMYNLAQAKNHIAGFYATVYGKVELKTKGGRRPADGANVTICDPHDGTSWETTADDNGEYEIEKAILHETCSPFAISAEWCRNRTEKQYTGPLTEPDPSERHKVDLLIVPSIRGEFEFRYDSQTMTPWGITVKDGYEHSVPFSVNFDKDPPSIEGEGKYSTVLTAKKGTLGGGSRVTMSETPGDPRVFQAGPIRIAASGLNALAAGAYTSDGFKETSRWIDKKELFGELIESKTGEEKLRMGFEQTSSSGGPPSKCGPWIFPLEDGYEREFPMEMSVAGIRTKTRLTVTLHLENEQ
jgi:hypothetical protein